jgi:hypothetical protein
MFFLAQKRTNLTAGRKNMHLKRNSSIGMAYCHKIILRSVKIKELVAPAEPKAILGGTQTAFIF